MLKKFCSVFLMLTMVGCTTIHLDESMLIRPTNTSLIEESLPEGYSFEEHEIKKSDGSISYGVSVTNPENPVTIMYFGGNMFDVPSQGRRMINSLLQSNVNVIMFDRRGYGRSTGDPSVSLLMEDAVEHYDFVRSIVNGKLILHGLSLGSFEAGYVASQRTVDALVLEGSATNVDEWSSSIVPWYAKPFVNITIADELKQVDNLNIVKTQTAPLLVIVGEKDNQTPIHLSESLYKHSGSDIKKLHVFDGGRHGNVTEHPDFSAVFRQFIDKALVL